LLGRLPHFTKPAIKKNQHVSVIVSFPRRRESSLFKRIPGFRLSASLRPE
jgi:hypothetical protein